MSDYGWLQSVKVGDKVARWSGGFSRTPFVYTVKSTTPKQIVLNNNERFWKKNGRVVGSDGWNYSHIAELTLEIEQDLRREAAIRTLKGIKWHELTNEVIYACIDAIQGASR